MSKFVKSQKNNENEDLDLVGLLKDLYNPKTQDVQSTTGYDTDTVANDFELSLNELSGNFQRLKNFLVTLSQVASIAGSKIYQSTPWYIKALSTIILLSKLIQNILTKGVHGYLKENFIIKPIKGARGVFKGLAVANIVANAAQIKQGCEKLAQLNTTLESLDPIEGQAELAKAIYSFFYVVLNILQFVPGIGLIAGGIMDILSYIDPTMTEKLTLQGFGFTENQIEELKKSANKTVSNYYRIYEVSVIGNKPWRPLPGTISYPTKYIILADIYNNKSPKLYPGQNGQEWGDLIIKSIPLALNTDEQTGTPDTIGVDIYNKKTEEKFTIQYNPSNFKGKIDDPEIQSIIKFRSDPFAKEINYYINKYAKENKKNIIVVKDLFDFITKQPEADQDYIKNNQNPNFAIFYKTLQEAVIAHNSNYKKISKPKESTKKEKAPAKPLSADNLRKKIEPYLPKQESKDLFGNVRSTTTYLEPRTIPVLERLAKLENNGDLNQLLRMKNSTLIDLILSRASLGYSKTVPKNLLPLKDNRGNPVGYQLANSPFLYEWQLWNDAQKYNYSGETFWLQDPNSPRFQNLKQDIVNIKRAMAKAAAEDFIKEKGLKKYTFSPPETQPFMQPTGK